MAAQHIIYMNKNSIFQANTLKNVECFYAVFYRLKRMRPQWNIEQELW